MSTDTEIRVKRSRSFDSLYSAINDMGEVKGSQKTYEPKELIGIIDEVRQGKIGLNYVTSTAGLRDKVKEILGNELVEKSKNLKDLYQGLRTIGDVKGSQGNYSTGEMIGIIEMAKEGKVPINTVTKNYGLREKVFDILTDFKDELSEKGYEKHSVFMRKNLDKLRVAEGFKLHVTSDHYHLRQVEEAVLPILEKHGVAHKIVDSGRDMLGKMTGSQEGKFITIYPNNDEELKAIAKEVDEALTKHNLINAGPKIKNDAQVPGNKSGMVFYTYAGHTRDWITGPKGEKVVEYNQQRRDGKVPPVPDWIQDPFKKKEKK